MVHKYSQSHVCLTFYGKDQLHWMENPPMGYNFNQRRRWGFQTTLVPSSKCNVCQNITSRCMMVPLERDEPNNSFKKNGCIRVSRSSPICGSGKAKPRQQLSENTGMLSFLMHLSSLSHFRLHRCFPHLWFVCSRFAEIPKWKHWIPQAAHVQRNAQYAFLLNIFEFGLFYHLWNLIRGIWRKFSSHFR